MQWHIDYHSSVGSTMDIAKGHIDAGLSEGWVIQAGEQLGGRGRRGNEWISPSGNLYQSIILKPSRPRSEWGQLSFVIAVALAQACFNSGISPSILKLKWPNDVLLSEKKLAGILIESYDDTVIIGTGINIAHAPEDRSFLHDFAAIDRDVFRDIFLACIRLSYDNWQDCGFAIIRDQWMKYAYKIGETIQVRLPDRIYEGIFKDLESDGTLILELENGTKQKINAGEIIV